MTRTKQKAEGGLLNYAMLHACSCKFSTITVLRLPIKYFSSWIHKSSLDGEWIIYIGYSWHTKVKNQDKIYCMARGSKDLRDKRSIL